MAVQDRRRQGGVETGDGGARAAVPDGALGFSLLAPYGVVGLKTGGAGIGRWWNSRASWQARPSAKPDTPAKPDPPAKPAPALPVRVTGPLPPDKGPPGPRGIAPPAPAANPAAPVTRPPLPATPVSSGIPAGKPPAPVDAVGTPPPVVKPAAPPADAFDLGSLYRSVGGAPGLVGGLLLAHGVLNNDARTMAAGGLGLAYGTGHLDPLLKMLGYDRPAPMYTGPPMPAEEADREFDTWGRARPDVMRWPRAAVDQGRVVWRKYRAGAPMSSAERAWVTSVLGRGASVNARPYARPPGFEVAPYVDRERAQLLENIARALHKDYSGMDQIRDFAVQQKLENPDKLISDAKYHIEAGRADAVRSQLVKEMAPYIQMTPGELDAALRESEQKVYGSPSSAAGA